MDDPEVFSMEEVMAAQDEPDVSMSEKEVFSTEEVMWGNDVENSIKNKQPKGFETENNIHTAMSHGDRDMGENIRISYDRGQDDQTLRQMAYSYIGDREKYLKEIEPIRLEYEKRRQEDPVDGKWWADAIYSVANMVPGVVGGGLDGMKYGSAVGLTTAAVPGGVAVAPAAFGVAATYGSASYWYRDGASELYMDMVAEGVEDDIAVPVSAIGGAIYGAIEFSQVFKLIPGSNKAVKKMVRKSITSTMKTAVKKYGKNWATEVGEEALQEIVMTVAKDIGTNASKITNISIGRMVQRAAEGGLQAGKESALPLLLMLAPGQVTDTARAVKATKQNKHTKPKPKKSEQVYYHRTKEQFKDFKTGAEMGKKNLHKDSVYLFDNQKQANDLVMVNRFGDNLMHVRVDGAVAYLTNTQDPDLKKLEGMVGNKNKVAQLEKQLTDMGYVGYTFHGETIIFDKTKLKLIQGEQQQESVYYHQTSKSAAAKIKKEGFTLEHGKARLGDERIPDGVYLKTSQKDISVGAIEPGSTEQVIVHVPTGNLLSVDTMHDLQSILNQDKKYVEMARQSKVYDSASAKEYDIVENKFRDPNMTLDEALEIAKGYGVTKEQVPISRGEKMEPIYVELAVETKILDEGKLKSQEAATKAREVATKYLQDQGYDYVYVKEDKGSFNRVTDNLIVLPHKIDDLVVDGGHKQLQEQEAELQQTLKRPKVKGRIRREASRMIDKVIVPISTRLKKINPKLKAALRRYEFDVNKGILDDEKAIKPFLEKMTKLGKKDFVKLDLALKNGNESHIKEVVDRKGMTKEYNALRTVLDRLYKDSKAVGYSIGYLDNYAPRRVRDVEAFLAHFYGSDDSHLIRSAIQNKEKDVGRKLEDVEVAALINTLLRGYQVSGIQLSRPGYLKERNIDHITPEINDFYYESQAAIVDYIYSVNDAIAARKFFGKHIQINQKTNMVTQAEVDGGQKKEASIYDFNLETTIGAYVLDLLVKGDINAQQEVELKDILTARFSPKGPGAMFAGMKNLGYITTMGNPLSAITQIGDLAFAYYKGGVLRTTGETIKATLGMSKITKEDVGIERIAQEFADGSKIAKAVSTIFKHVGLTKMDRIGKQALINTQYSLYKSLAKKKRPNKDFHNKLKEVFGNEADQVLDDIRNGRVTDNVKLLLFSDLADVQPVALSEMPQGYLRGGNGRVFYMLKTYTIKMWDVYRNEVELEPNKLKAARNFIRLTTFLVLMNATADQIKDWILGRELSWGERLVENILKLASVSRYTFYRAKSEGIFSAIGKGYLWPPLEPTNTGELIIKDIMRANKEGEISFDQLDSIQRIPYGGKLLYWWFGRGREKANKTTSGRSKA